MARKLPRLHSLSEEDVDYLIRDLRLEESGTNLRFVIDPHEIFDFCFPIKPQDLRPSDIDGIADDQAALYEMFYVKGYKPILLPEYTRELHSAINYFNHSVDNWYSKAELLEALIKEGGLEKITKKTEKEVQDIIENNFNVILAVAMGLYKLGIDRFREVIREHLLDGWMEATSPEDETALSDIFESYEQTTLVDAVYDALETRIVEGTDDPAARERQKRTLLVDARAIDRVIFLNSALDRAYERGALQNPYMLLYLSASRRTRTIFSLRIVREALPVIGGSRYSPWRTRRQLFAYVVHKSKNENLLLQVRESIQNLEKVKDVLAQVRKLEAVFTSNAAECTQCVLEGGNGRDCPLITFCRDVSELRDDIQKSRQEIRNLGLFGTVVSTADEYRRLLETKPPQSYAVYLHLFAEACNAGSKDIAMDRMQEKQQWILIKSEDMNLFKEGFSLAKQAPEWRGFRSSKDYITGIDQILPTKPRLKTRKYKTILQYVLDYYKAPRDIQRVQGLEKAYTRYKELSPGVEKREPEHELIRSYLFLAFARGADENRAYDFARELVALARTEENDWLEQETRYVLCWAARRVGKFAEADECAKIAMEKWKDDPRFCHGRSLNIYSWLSDTHIGSACPYTVQDAITYARVAVEGYERDHSKNVDVIASNYNNLAYFLAWDVTQNQYQLEEASKSLDRSRQYLTKLKNLVTKETWAPSHPEFFHTEAYLEYQEYLVDWLRTKDPEHLKEKLEYAKKEIGVALRLYKDGPCYQELKELIDKRLGDISAGRGGSITLGIKSTTRHDTS